jgi:hypothetical protein
MDRNLHKSGVDWACGYMNLKIVESHTEKGERVRFHVSDVFLPSPPDVLGIDAEDAEMEGRVIDFSDLGSRRQFFAVIEVVQKHKVVVAAEKLVPAKGPWATDI